MQRRCGRRPRVGAPSTRGAPCRASRSSAAAGRRRRVLASVLDGVEAPVCDRCTGRSQRRGGMRRGGGASGKHEPERASMSQKTVPLRALPGADAPLRARSAGAGHVGRARGVSALRVALRRLGSEQTCRLVRWAGVARASLRARDAPAPAICAPARRVTQGGTPLGLLAPAGGSCASEDGGADALLLDRRERLRVRSFCGAYPGAFALSSVMPRSPAGLRAQPRPRGVGRLWAALRGAGRRLSG